MRSVPEPAAHPVLALIMCIDEDPTSGYGEPLAVGVGYGVGLTLGDALVVGIGVPTVD
jgi:hypothetical protein